MVTSVYLLRVEISADSQRERGKESSQRQSFKSKYYGNSWTKFLYEPFSLCLSSFNVFCSRLLKLISKQIQKCVFREHMLKRTISTTHRHTHTRARAQRISQHRSKTQSAAELHEKESLQFAPRPRTRTHTHHRSSSRIRSSLPTHTLTLHKNPCRREPRVASLPLPPSCS